MHIEKRAGQRVWRWEICRECSFCSWSAVLSHNQETCRLPSTSDLSGRCKAVAAGGPSDERLPCTQQHFGGGGGAFLRLKLQISSWLGNKVFLAAHTTGASTYSRGLSAACGASWQFCMPRTWRCSGPLLGENTRKKRLALHLRNNQTQDDSVQLNSNITISDSKDRGKNGVLETILHWAKALKPWQSIIQKKTSKS